MTSFPDLQDPAKSAKARRLHLCGWLIAVVFLTLTLFLLNYVDSEYPIYIVSILLSLLMFLAELACVFRNSGCRVTPLLIFLAALYLTRNSQLLLILFGVQFDVHHLVLLRQYLKSGIILTSIGNIWGGFAGVIVAAPQKQLPERTERADLPTSALTRFLMIGLFLTGPVAYAGILQIILLGFGIRFSIPRPVSVIGNLFVPFGFAALICHAKFKKGAAAAGLLVGYFLLAALYGDISAGIAGLFVLTVFFCCLWGVPEKRGRNAAVLAAVLLLLAVLSVLFGYLNMPGAFEGKSAGGIAIKWISGIGCGCLPLLAMMRVVPASESFLFGREYAESLLKGVIPRVRAGGLLDQWTSDTMIWMLWDEKYLQTFPEDLGFSVDAEAYLNFGFFGFLAVFLICLGMALLLDRYRAYGRGGMFVRYTACVMLWAGLTVSGKDLSHLVGMFVWGVVLMGLAWRLCTRKK